MPDLLKAVLTLWSWRVDVKKKHELPFHRDVF